MWAAGHMVKGVDIKGDGEFGPHTGVFRTQCTRPEMLWMTLVGDLQHEQKERNLG